MEEKGFSSMRKYEIDMLLSFVKRGEFCQLIGLPGVGREHLFELLSSNKAVRRKHLGEEEKAYHFVLTDFAELRGKETRDVLKLLFLELSDSLRDRKYEGEYEKVKQELDDTLSKQDSTILLQGLKRSIEYLSTERNLHLVFLFDRFEEYIPQVEDDFFVALSTLRNRSDGKFSVVFALTRPLEHGIEPEYFKGAYDLLAGNRVFMRVCDEQAIAFEVEKLEGQGNVFPREIINEVIRLTGGHRRMVITALEDLGRSDFTLTQTLPPQGRGLQGNVWERGKLKEILLDSLPVRNISYQIWNSLRPQEQLLLKRQVQREGEDIAETEDEQKRIQYFVDVGLLKSCHPELVSGSQKMLKQVRPPASQSVAARVQHDNKIGYEFTLPLFASFVRYRVEHRLDEKLIFKPDSEQILYGQEDITNKFTSSERRSLLFFFANRGRVVTRDELIGAVWKDTQTTEGVTDQALDQLIYRIRRKIEPDFSNPRYLQTIKGIGFRFSL